MGQADVDAVLCDVDGVIRHWDPDGMRGVDRRYGMPEGTLAAYAFAPERLLPAITGAQEDADWRAGVAVDLAADGLIPPDAVSEVPALWRAGGATVDAEVVALLTDVRRTHPVVLVTNQSTSFEEELAAAGLADLASAVVSSARVGVAKPDPEIYRLGAEAAGCPVERCLFVDDTEGHVRAAEALGMTGFWYAGTTDLDALRRAAPGGGA